MYSFKATNAHVFRFLMKNSRYIVQREHYYLHTFLLSNCMFIVNVILSTCGYTCLKWLHTVTENHLDIAWSKVRESKNLIEKDFITVCLQMSVDWMFCI